MTHAEAMKRRPAHLPDSDCPGQLVRRLFKPNSRYLVCQECGTRVTLCPDGSVWCTDERREAATAATEPGPSS